ncbi:MAG: sulfatase-like hydrolase/transferase [Planctomycetota bacterium]
MTDDQGWGDVGLRDPTLRTPELDALFREGVEIPRFYAAAPVCSPTRASVLTGRHPARMGIDGANDGHLPPGEICLAEALRDAGYRTGFFGKWHLGTLTRDVRDSNRGGRPAQAAHYAPPWEHGFDVTFATEAKVPTFDPMVRPGTEEPFGTRYWTGPGEAVDASTLEGDDSRLIVERASRFLEECERLDRPAFAVVWLHAPHEPIVASPGPLQRLDLDPDSARARYVACLADVDAQVGALAEALRPLDPAVLFFCSDNGPEHRDGPGSTAGLRGRKRDLFEGGIRVPAAVWWTMSDPAFEGVLRRRARAPAGTVDLFPTALDLAGVETAAANLDGRSLVTEDGLAARYAFRSKRQRAYVHGDWKIHSADAGESWSLYDIGRDPGEGVDRREEGSDRASTLIEAFRAWERGVLADRADAPAASR